MKIKLFFDLFLDKLKLTSYQKRRKKYNIGEYSYINHTTKIGRAKIGKFCSIAADTVIGVGNHPMNFLTTSPFIYSRNKVCQLENILLDEKNLIQNKIKLETKPETVIGNDVWIGEKAIIMLGVNVSDGAVIAAGAIVTHDVPPYAIVAGVPARIIKYRFDENIRQKLLELKWWNFPKEFIVKLPFEDINKCIEILERNQSIKND